MKSELFAVFAISVLSFSYTLGFSDTRYDLGVINDLAPDGANYYYFEADKDIESSAWIQDTRIKIDDGNSARNLSEKLFIHPTELRLDESHLYFAVLSERCVGQILCDHQDVYKMSKKDGSFSVLAKDLRSSIHISLDGDSLYVSESTGKIWKINHQDGSKKLAVHANEIIMDVISKDDTLYWIEEIAEQNSSVLTLGEKSSPTTVAKNLQIPYDLTVQNGRLYWSEIQVKAVEGNFAEVTSIKSYDGKTATLMEFHNTSPVSIALNQANYGPYLVIDDYLFLVNNTNDKSVIHMLNLYNSTKYDVGIIAGYDAKYLRSDGVSLLVVGKNENGFVIDKYPLPIKVPEFPVVFLAVLSFGFASVLILQRFWRS
ncbi:MAG: hypothetical protein ACT4NT_04480 [Nitrososphaerota archaeon]